MWFPLGPDWTSPTLPYLTLPYLTVPYLTLPTLTATRESFPHTPRLATSISPDRIAYSSIAYPGRAYPPLRCLAPRSATGQTGLAHLGDLHRDLDRQYFSSSFLPPPLYAHKAFLVRGPGSRPPGRPLVPLLDLLRTDLPYLQGSIKISN